MAKRKIVRNEKIRLILESITYLHERSKSESWIVDLKQVHRILSKCDSNGKFDLPPIGTCRVKNVVYEDARRKGLTQTLNFQEYVEFCRQDRLEVEASYKIRISDNRQPK